MALAYGAWGEKLVNGEVTEGIVRSTVVLDPEGNVKLAQYQVKAQGHVAALKDALGVLSDSAALSDARTPGPAAPSESAAETG